MVSVLVCRRVAACALPRPSATASAKLANSTVNQSQRLIWNENAESPAPVTRSRRNRSVVSAATTSTTNITGLRTSSARVELARTPRRSPGTSDLRVEHRGDRHALAGLREFHGDMASIRSQNSVPACIAKCSTIGPSASAGKKVRPPTIRITPISRPTNSGAVGREGAGGGRHDLLAASEPATASIGTIMTKRPISMARPMRHIVEGRVAR